MELHSGYDDIEMEQPIGSITIQSNETDVKLTQFEQEIRSQEMKISAQDQEIRSLKKENANLATKIVKVST